MTLTLSTGITGLDHVLGGGLRLLERLAGAGVSGSLLIRGGAGVGKSVLAAQIAVTVADAMGGDVVYGCVELLPVELDAQLGGFKFSKLGPRVLPPFNEAPARDENPRIFTSLLDLGDEGVEPERLGDAITRLLDDVAAGNGNPKVLVIDSLSNGYKLGSDVPRPLADAIIKLAAARGLMLVLVEEVSDEKQSNWVFAVDTAIQLVPHLAETFSTTLPFSQIDRPLAIVKHRLQRSDAGPHSYRIDSDGLRVHPRLAAYMRDWKPAQLGPKEASPLSIQWGIPQVDRQKDFPEPGSSITAVCGEPSAVLFAAAFRLMEWKSSGTQSSPDQSAPWTLYVYFGAIVADVQSTSTQYQSVTLRFGDPFLTGSTLATNILDFFDQQRRNGRRIYRVVFLDFARLRNHLYQDEIRQAAFVLGHWFRTLGVGTILLESGPIAPPPAIVDKADVVFKVSAGALPQSPPIVTVETHMGGNALQIPVPWQ